MIAFFELFIGYLQRLISTHDAKLFPVNSDNTQLLVTDIFIELMFLFAYDTAPPISGINKKTDTQNDPYPKQHDKETLY